MSSTKSDQFPKISLQLDHSKWKFKMSKPFKRPDYPELTLFKQQIEQGQKGTNFKPYTLNKRQVLLYRSIFFGLAILFAILAITVICIPSGLTYGLFTLRTVFKSLMVAFSCCLAGAALVLAITMRTEKETIVHLANQAKRRVGKIYARTKIKCGFKRFFLFCAHYRQQNRELKIMYQEACDKISDHKEEALALSNRIASSSLNPSSQEVLFNQAIAEFSDKLHSLIHTLTHSTHVYFSKQHLLS